MNNRYRTLTAFLSVLMLLGLGGCKSEELEPGLVDEQPSQGYLDMIGWNDVSDAVKSIEEETKNMIANEPNALINLLAENIVSFELGVDKNNLESSYESYRAACILANDKDEDVAELGREAKEFFLSAYGFSEEDGIVAFDNYYATLQKFSDILDKELEIPMWYK